MNSSLVGLFTSIAFGTAAAFAADLLDAPGPGYRNQLERPTYRPDLLDALPPTRFSPEERARRQKQFLQRVERFRGIRIHTNPLFLSDEIRRLSPKIPELPTANPFERPIRLFDAQ